MTALSFFGLLLLVFAATFGASYLVVWFSRGLKGSAVPIEGGAVRLKCTHGVYRSRFLGVSSAGWRLTAPLSRDSYVPLRPGDELVLEAPVVGAALTARTRVVSRDADSHELMVARPSRTHRLERRETRRLLEPNGVSCTLEGSEAAIVDISRFGARLDCSAAVGSGERVRLDLQWFEEPVFAWVLEVLPVEGSRGRRTLCRVRFEDGVSLPSGLTPA